MKTNKNLTQKIAVYGILSALALVLSLFDNLITPEMAILPMGAKLGLSNIVIMVAAGMSVTGGYYILLIKVLFAFVTRGVTAGLMSLSGGLLATTATILLLKINTKKLSYLGIAVISAVLHNMGQLACATVISGTMYLLNYGKWLLLFAVITGSVTGIVLNLLMPRLDKTQSLRLNKGD